MLEFINANIGYSKAPIVRDVSFSLSPSEVIVVVGKNGSGKSTILKSIFGFSKLFSGEVKINGQRVNELNTAVIAQYLTPLFANNSLAEGLRVKDIIDFSIDRRCLGESEKTKAKEKYCSLFKIEEFLEKRVGEISDGMLQRVLIARAFCLNTPYIYLDEPTTYLDIESQVEILEIVFNLVKSESKGVVINTHNSLWVKKFSESLYKIDDGIFSKASFDSLSIPQD